MVQVIPEKITPPVELPRVSRERLLATLGESLESCNSTVAPCCSTKRRGRRSAR